MIKFGPPPRPWMPISNPRHLKILGKLVEENLVNTTLDFKGDHNVCN